MAAITHRLMTAEEFFDFASRPENDDRFLELDEGKVIERPLGGRAHGFVCANVASRFWRHCQAMGQGYVCSNNVGVILSRAPDTVLGPDVALFMDERSYEDMLAEDGYARIVPALVIEVLSHSDSPGSTSRRIGQYLAAGIRLAWAIDLTSRNATIYRAGAEPELIGLDGALDGGEILPGTVCKVADLFRMTWEA